MPGNSPDFPVENFKMPFVPVPKDLTKVKSKVVFGLTVRQLVCFGAGGLAGIPAYLLTRGSIGNDAAAMLMIGLMLPFFLFGIYEKDGQRMEQVLGHIIRAKFLYPQTRPYQTDNFYAALERQHRKEEQAEFETKATGNAEKKTARRVKRFQTGKARTARRGTDGAESADSPDA